MREHHNAIRASLLRLHDRLGWKALGYSSWQEFGKAEFGFERAHLYRMLEAAKVERNIGISARYSESVLRELAVLDSADDQREALELAKQVAATKEYTGKAAVHKGKLTAVIMRESVATIRARQEGIQCDQQAAATGPRKYLDHLSIDKDGNLKVYLHIGNSLIVETVPRNEAQQSFFQPLRARSKQE